MPDENRSSTATIVIVILIIVVILGLIGLCLCGGLGFFMLRASSLPPPPAAPPGQPFRPNEPMLKRLIDEATGPAPPLPPPVEQPSAPVAPEVKNGDIESQREGPDSPKAERDALQKGNRS